MNDLIHPSFQLPEQDEIRKLLDEDDEGSLNLFHQSLLEPAADLLSRPSKLIRAELARIAYGLAMPEARSSQEFSSADRKRIQTCAEVIESIHSGSLVIDDIEDGSQVRRGKPTLHRTYGMPIALNLGNWLYFWPLERLQHENWSPTKELAAYRIIHRTLLQAHYGQAIDLGTPIDQIDQNQIHSTCLLSLKLKTGALMTLAMGLSAIAADSTETTKNQLISFASDFGIALQMFDDIGNLKSSKNPEKRMEDLLNRRPSWIWATAAQTLNSIQFKEFVEVLSQTSLPEESEEVYSFLSEKKVIQNARDQAEVHLKNSLHFIEKHFANRIEFVDEIHLIARKLVQSYG